MDIFLLWLGLGLVLIVVELLTGTLYLLFLGLAALVTAAVAFLGVGFWAQAMVAAGCSVAGVLWVNRHKRTINAKPMPSLDAGQPVVLESWVDQAGGRARVRYRDAFWDARVSGECSGQAGEVLYVHAVEGSTLVVAKSPAA
jgi:membrane protein implicated in regulation of membrane protease activity